MALSSTERSKRLRKRRRRGHMLVTVEIDRLEARKLVALGYLDAGAMDQGRALNAAVEAYLSDKLFDEAAPAIGVAA
jgi:hypothetical protein